MGLRPKEGDRLRRYKALKGIRHKDLPRETLSSRPSHCSPKALALGTLKRASQN